MLHTLKKPWRDLKAMWIGNPGIAASEVAKRYQRLPSLSQHINLREYDPKSKQFLLADNSSVGMGIELSMLASEARSSQAMDHMAHQLAAVIKQAIPQEKMNPWVVQIYLQDEPNLKTFTQKLKQHVSDGDRVNHPLTQSYLNTMEAHLHYMTQTEGVFIDRDQGDRRFQACQRRVRILVYRKTDTEKSKSITGNHGLRRQAVEQLIKIRRRFCTQLRDLGLKPKLMDGQAMFEWLIAWFNPAPKVTNGKLSELLEKIQFPLADNLPFGWDFGERCFFSQPKVDNNLLYFDEMPHKALLVQGLPDTDQIATGQLSGECQHGDQIYSLFDKFPEGSILCMTLVIQHVEEVEHWLARNESSAIGMGVRAQRHRALLQEANRAVEAHNFLFPMTLTVYIRAQDEIALTQAQSDVESLFVGWGFHMVSDEHHLTPIDTYIRYLPMNYDFSCDRRFLKQSQLVFADTIAKLLPVYGRGTGTANPGFVFFNRGGEPFCFDLFKDKTKNGHTLVLGETGTGKSNLCVGLLTSLLAAHNPRCFILEAGGSFDLFADYLKSHGLSMNRIKITPEAPISLNPFADGLRVLEQLEKLDNISQEKWRQRAVNEEEEAEGEPMEETAIDAQRDILGEMVIASLLMITGCEEREEATITRRDRSILVDAIILAAETVRKAERDQMIASDVVDALNHLADTLDVKRDHDRIERARRMADNMTYFCRDPLSKQFFNTQGSPWPLVDVTIVDFGLFAQDGYEAHRAIAYAGINSRILSIAEATQSSERPIICAQDELHIFLRVPLLAAMLTREAKMARKLGMVLLLLTQNMRDFTDGAEKVLAMIENFLCLALPPDEIEQVERFRRLTEEERLLFESAKKVPKQYTEGVLLSPAVKGLFRIIPPRLFLQLAATDKHEKYARQKIMKAQGISEIEAVHVLAQNMMHQTVEMDDAF